MFIKTLSMILIFASSSMLGLYLSRLDEYRLKELLMVKKMAMMLASEIEYSSSLVNAFTHISERLEGAISLLIMDVAVELSKRKGNTFMSIWKKNCEHYSRNTYLTPVDWQYIQDFGKNLGYLDKHMQHKNISMFIHYLDDSIQKINSQKDSNKRMYRSLGVLIGILIIIILI